jgi:hypothetical protein
LIVQPEKEGDSLQREALSLLQKFITLKKWERQTKIPSTRVQAFYGLLKIAAKCPDLKQ